MWLRAPCPSECMPSEVHNSCFLPCKQSGLWPWCHMAAAVCFGALFSAKQLLGRALLFVLGLHASSRESLRYSSPCVEEWTRERRRCVPSSSVPPFREPSFGRPVAQCVLFLPKRAPLGRLEGDDALRRPPPIEQPRAGHCFPAAGRRLDEECVFHSCPLLLFNSFSEVRHFTSGRGWGGSVCCLLAKESCW